LTVREARAIVARDRHSSSPPIPRRQVQLSRDNPATTSCRWTGEFCDPDVPEWSRTARAARVSALTVTTDIRERRGSKKESLRSARTRTRTRERERERERKRERERERRRCTSSLSSGCWLFRDHSGSVRSHVNEGRRIVRVLAARKERERSPRNFCACVCSPRVLDTIVMTLVWRATLRPLLLLVISEYTWYTCMCI